MTTEDGWTTDDIKNMSMEDYKKYREHIFNYVSDLTPEELVDLEEIPMPPKPFHFRGF